MSQELLKKSDVSDAYKRTIDELSKLKLIAKPEYSAAMVVLELFLKQLTAKLK